MLSRIIDQMDKGADFQTVFYMVIALVLGVVLCRGIAATLSWECSTRYMRIQDSFTLQNAAIAMGMEYAHTEEQETLDLYTHAWRANLSPGTILEKTFLAGGYIFQLIGCVGVIGVLHPILIGVVVAAALGSMACDAGISRREREYAIGNVPLERYLDYLYRCMGESTGAKDVRLYYPQSFFPDKVKILQGKRGERFREKCVSCFNLQKLQALLAAAQTMLLYLVLIRMFQNGSIPIGSFSLAISAATIVGNALRGVSQCFTQLQEQEHYLQYLERFRKLKRKEQLPENGQEIQQRKKEPDTSAGFMVEYRHVWFRYPGREDYALKDVNLTLDLAKEKMISVVGENGSGKTTFIKLLLGLYHPEKGEIRINGIDINTYSEQEFQKFFSAVFQDYQLFAYTIRENLLGEAANESSQNMDELRSVLEGLGLWERIQKLPKGLEQYVGRGYESEGIEMSGGERQRIAIARALIKNSRALVFDEPTAALDPLAEMEVCRIVRRLSEEASTKTDTDIAPVYPQKMCFFITHRLSGVYFSDMVLYFKEGRIVEMGDYRQLLGDKKEFYQFYELQAKYYRKGQK